MTIKRFCNIIFCVTFVLSCYIFGANSPVLAESESGSNSADYEYTQANDWVYSLIQITGAPSYATVDSITIKYNVDSNSINDIHWYVENYTKWESPYYIMPVTGDDWFDGYNETSEKTYTITPDPGTPVNGLWYFNIEDTNDDGNVNGLDEGRIDSWELTINWTDLPKAGDITGADPDTFSPGQTRTVTVRVTNEGRDDQNLIVDPGDIPSGWNVSPSNVQFIVPYNTSADFDFSVEAPPEGGTGNIEWKLYYDEPFNPINTLLDTYYQTVSAPLPTYSLSTSVSPSAGGSVSPSGGDYTSGTVLSIRASENTGYDFDHWGGSLSGSTNPQNLTMDGDKNVTAYFTLETRTLTTSVSPSGSGSVSPSSGTYDYGTLVSVQAIEDNSAYRFDHWGGSLSGDTNPQNLNMTTNRSVTAYFEPKFDLRAIDVYPCDEDGDEITGNIHVGDAIYICLEWSATGSGTTPSFYREIYLDGSRKSRTNPTAIGGNTYIGIWGPWNATEGTHSVKGILDSDDDLPETSESNNERSETSCFSVTTAPEITLNPTALTFDMNNDVRVHTITITNTGTAELKWKYDFLQTDPVFWGNINVSPRDGTLQPSNSEDIEIVVDYSEWQDGTHNGDIVISNSDDTTQFESIDTTIVVSKNSGNILYGVHEFSQEDGDCGVVSLATILGYWDYYPDPNGVVFWNLIDHGNYKTGDVGPTDNKSWGDHGNYPPERPLTDNGLIARLRVLTNWYARGEPFTDQNGNGILDWEDLGCDHVITNQNLEWYDPGYDSDEGDYKYQVCENGEPFTDSDMDGIWTESGTLATGQRDGGKLFTDDNSERNNLGFQFAVQEDSLFKPNNVWNNIKEEIDDERPCQYMFYSFNMPPFDFNGGHAIPVVGYRQTANVNWLIVHDNYDPAPENYSIDDLLIINVEEGDDDHKMLSIIPGGTPRDHYDYNRAGDTWGADDTLQNASIIEPALQGQTDQAFTSRQTHNFHQAGDTDWIQFSAEPNRRYSIRIYNRGSNYTLETDLYKDSGNTFIVGHSGTGSYTITYDSYSSETIFINLFSQTNSFGHDTNFDIEVTYENLVFPDTPTPSDPSGTIYTLEPTFNWSSFQNGGDGATQAGFQIRVRSDSDGDQIVYDTGFISDTSLSTHTYQPSGTYTGWDYTCQCYRYSEDLEWGKQYHWHVRYRDSKGVWSDWSADENPDPHHDFYTAVPGILDVSPATSLTASGDQGGPFSPSSKSYTLENTGNTTINWAASKTQSWINLSSTGGSLAAGSSTTVTVSINSNADSIDPGSYSDMVSFQNVTNGNGDTTRAVNLNIGAVPGALYVSPSSSLTVSGDQGGPFSPSSKIYTLENTGGTTINWSTSHNQSWVNLSSTGGSLAPGSSTTVTVSINSNAGSLAPESYSDTVSFTNTTNGDGNTTRAVNLTVNAAQGALTVTPSTGLTSSGNEGGPFSPTSVIYTLQNTGDTAISWTASKEKTWVNLSSSGGSLEAGDSTTVTVSINSNAESLTPESYSDTVSFTNITNGEGNTTRAVNLTVNSVQGALTVTPSTGLTSSGNGGGPFSPISMTYTLQNTGDTAISWTASKEKTWVSLSSNGGSLAAGSSTTVTVSINSNAESLTPESYSDTVSFINETNGEGNTARAINLTVNGTQGVLTVTPSTDLTSSGNEGGPFSPPNITYTLQNTGDTAINWTASKGEAWVSLSSENGTLAAGASIAVVTSINSSADSLLPESYSDTISFANTTNGVGDTTRAVHLTVNATQGVLNDAVCTLKILAGSECGNVDSVEEINGDDRIGIEEALYALRVSAGLEVPIETVVSAGRVWMDRNLGASRVATSPDDAEAFGDLYQWGRDADGHQARNSRVTSVKSTDDDPGHSKFILDNDNTSYDWRTPQNNDLWQRETGLNDPCPSGFRLPTKAELEAEMATWGTNDKSGAFTSPLRLPAAGMRQRTDGAVIHDGNYGHYWSSTVESLGANSLNTYDASAVINGYGRSFGQSVRCIKDE